MKRCFLSTAGFESVCLLLLSVVHLPWRMGPKQGQGLGGGQGLCLGCTGLENVPGDWRGGVRLKEQKGPRHSPHPWSRREGDLTWEPSRLPGLEWAGQMPSSPLLLLPEGPSHLPLLISPASLLYPQDQCGQGGGVALEGRGPAWELSRLTVLEWAGQTPSLLSSFSQRVPLACLS